MIKAPMTCLTLTKKQRLMVGHKKVNQKSLSVEKISVVSPHPDTCSQAGMTDNPIKQINPYVRRNHHGLHIAHRVGYR